MEERHPRRSRRRQLVKEVSLYYHIPFCTKKCPYCHFYVIPNRLSHRQLLAKSLVLEWEQQKSLLVGKEVVSIYFGGGTPTLFQEVGRILEKIPRKADCEITIEANPEELTLEKLKELHSFGFNRLSLGVQSLDDRSLNTLERTHSAAKARTALHDAAKAGFQSVSIDLMYDLPGQTEESWRYTLDQLADLPLHHLSLYNLTIEPHTAFHQRKVTLPPKEFSLRFLTAALEKLESIGLRRYEISAFALPGHESRHNLGYWTGRPFLGLGPSAFSYWEGERFRNIANLSFYAKQLAAGLSPIDFREKLSYPANIKELLAIHLRLREGVTLTSLSLPLETEQAIHKLKQEGLLHEEAGQLKLTDRGYLLYDTVATDLI